MMHDYTWKCKQTLLTDNHIIYWLHSEKSRFIRFIFRSVMCRCDGLVQKLLSSPEDEISPSNPGMMGLRLPVRKHLGRVLVSLHSFRGLNLSGLEGSPSENIQSRFSENLCSPCRHRFQRSGFTARPGSVQFPRAVWGRRRPGWGFGIEGSLFDPSQRRLGLLSRCACPVKMASS